MIPDEAVEAAARVAWAKNSEVPWGLVSGGYQLPYLEYARELIEAAAPHLMAAAWDEGFEDAVDAYDGRNVSNPYRKPNDARG